MAQDTCYSFTSTLPACYEFMSHLPDCYTFYSSIADPVDPNDPENVGMSSDIAYPVLPEFTIPGFSAFKCVQAHGLNELVVIGKYKPGATLPERPVIAKITYRPGFAGGVGKVGHVSFYKNLSAYGVDYDDIDRLDGWDILSTTSEVCIVESDTHVLWLDGLLLEVVGDTDDFGGSSNSLAADNPYFHSDTYGATKMLGASRGGVGKTDEHWTSPVKDYAFSEPGAHDYTIETQYISSRSQDIVSYSQEDGSEASREERKGMRYREYGGDSCCGGAENCMQSVSNGTVLSGWCISSGGGSPWGDEPVGSPYEKLKQRNGLMIVMSSDYQDVYVTDDFSVSYQGPISTGRRYQYSHVGNDGTGYVNLERVVFYDYTYARVTSMSGLVDFYDSGIKLCRDGNYYACVHNSSFYYISKSGTKSGSVSGKNSTLCYGVVITANGSDQLTQTVIS